MKFWNHIKWPGLAGAVLLALLLTSQGSIFRLGLSSVIPPGVVSPSSLVITLDEVDLAEVINGPFRVRVLPNPISLDVIKNTGQASNIFGSGGVLPTTYNGIRFVLNWKGTYAGINPCTGDVATDVDNQFQMPDADLVNHQRVEQLQVAHPVTGLQSGATGQIDAIHVGSDPVTLKLIVPASNSLGCVSDTPPSQEISGTDTGMASPFGVFVANNEIFISNNNSKALLSSTGVIRVMSLRNAGFKAQIPGSIRREVFLSIRFTTSLTSPILEMTALLPMISAVIRRYRI